MKQIIEVIRDLSRISIKDLSAESSEVGDSVSDDSAQHVRSREPFVGTTRTHIIYHPGPDKLKRIISIVTAIVSVGGSVMVMAVTGDKHAVHVRPVILIDKTSRRRSCVA